MDWNISEKSTETPEEALYLIAESQEGLFTAQQAENAGFDKSNHHYHVKAGNWERELRGVYRLKNFPYSEDSEYVRWFLWSRNKENVPQGVFSHYTALSIYDISDAMPAKVHMTVPKNFRRQAEIPKLLVLYKGEIPEEDIEQMRGFKVTRPLKTIYELVVSKMEPKDSELIYQAIGDAIRKGLFSRVKLKGSKLWPLIKENKWSF